MSHLRKAERTMQRPTEVDFHFDVMCPWAYQTSLWMREVRDQTDLTVNWRFFSLEEVNLVEGKKHPWEREWSYGWSMMRIGAVLRRQSMELLDQWYAAAGKALHVCLFGPVLLDPPRGEAALRLWDAVTAWTEFPQLYELQRPKGNADTAAIAETFRPYLQARDWVSINRGKIVEFDTPSSSIPPPPRQR